MAIAEDLTRDKMALKQVPEKWREAMQKALEN